MRKLKMLYGSVATCDSDISHAESLVGLEFPLKLKQFFLLMQGGRPEDCVFESERFEFIVNEFYPLIAIGRCSALQVYLKLVVELRLLPRNYFPVATDPGGNELWVDINHPACPLYLYDHDTYFVTERFVEMKVSLEEFLESLKPE